MIKYTYLGPGRTKRIFLSSNFWRSNFLADIFELPIFSLGRTTEICSSKTSLIDSNISHNPLGHGGNDPSSLVTSGKTKHFRAREWTHWLT